MPARRPKVLVAIQSRPDATALLAVLVASVSFNLSQPPRGANLGIFWFRLGADDQSGSGNRACLTHRYAYRPFHDKKQDECGLPSWRREWNLRVGHSIIPR
jgi:hypothetical protein